MSEDVLGVILAGGLARRMGGGDKTLLSLGAVPMLSRIVARLEPQVMAQALNANGPAARFQAFGLDVLPDPVPDFPGPLAGVLAGLDHAAALGLPWVATVAGDTPFFPEDYVARLIARASETGAPIVLAATKGEDGPSLHPTMGLWSADLRDDLRGALGDGIRKVLRWTDRHGATEAVWDAAPFDPFINVNTPEDLAMAEGLLEGRP